MIYTFFFFTAVQRSIFIRDFEVSVPPLKAEPLKSQKVYGRVARIISKRNLKLRIARQIGRSGGAYLLSADGPFHTSGATPSKLMLVFTLCTYATRTLRAACGERKTNASLIALNYNSFLVSLTKHALILETEWKYAS